MLALSGAPDASAAQPTDPFAACRALFAEKPDDYESAACFARVALDERLWPESRRAFDALIAAHPANLWLPLAYGNAWVARSPERAEQLYRRAADGFKASAHREGELLARSTLRTFLFPRGRVDEAAREAARVVEIGDASTDPLLKAAAWSLHALHIQDTGGDLGHALRLLKQAESAIFPGGPYRLKRANLVSLGQVASRLARFDEALAIYARLDALATEEANAPDQAIARFNVFNTMAMKENVLPTPHGREGLMQRASQALAAGRAAPHELVTIRSHGALAELLAKAPGARAAALQHVTECLTLATRARRPHDEAFCSWIEAAIRKSTEPELARAAEIRALDATARADNPRTDAYSAGRHMRHSWSTRPRDTAVRDSLLAIDTLETLRALQDDADSSAALFSAWTLDYYWLSGRLLQEDRVEDVALAFSITERMRGRSLLDVLDRSGAAPDPTHVAMIERTNALESIAAVQRRLMDPVLDAVRRSALLTELERHEDRVREARRQIALAFPDRRRAQPAFASLAAVQSSLLDHEAFLSFQIGLWETYEGDNGGGSWLVAVTNDGTTVHRLPDRTRLSPVIPVFVGLLQAGDGRETAAAVRLYEELLADAVAALPRRITRLVVAADGALHHLPLESLRATPASPPLGAQYELVHVPSATLWRHWRTTPRTKDAGRLLSFADPAVAASAGAADSRNAVLFDGLRLGRLPRAREESRAIERHIAATRALVDADASERALKDTDLRTYDVLHFAAHAVADESHPERSAVLLAAGDGREDGLLQVREIQALDLDGRIVVLSACQTASGAVQSGEGVLSLARAFFEAGAHAVVGSRWPLRDDDAAVLFDAFYRRLADGASLAEALKGTQDEARAAGRPATAWAGLVLLGNGDLRPFLGAPRPGRGAAAYLVLGVVTILVVTLAVTRRRWRRQSHEAAGV
jgi:CHAT domain-containing protein/tetratricopeptide (TPR) repeat protein